MRPQTLTERYSPKVPIRRLEFPTPVIDRERSFQAFAVPFLTDDCDLESQPRLFNKQSFWGAFQPHRPRSIAAFDSLLRPHLRAAPSKKHSKALTPSSSIVVQASNLSPKLNARESLLEWHIQRASECGMLSNGSREHHHLASGFSNLLRQIS